MLGHLRRPCALRTFCAPLWVVTRGDHTVRMWPTACSGLDAMSTITRTLLLVTLLGAGGCKKSEGGPAISEADKTSKPTEAQCDTYAAHTVKIGANPESMQTYIRDQCVAQASVALVKCVEPATKTADLGNCLAKYPLK